MGLGWNLRRAWALVSTICREVSVRFDVGACFRLLEGFLENSRRSHRLDAVLFRENVREGHAEAPGFLFCKGSLELEIAWRRLHKAGFGRWSRRLPRSEDVTQQVDGDLELAFPSSGSGQAERMAPTRVGDEMQLVGDNCESEGAPARGRSTTSPGLRTWRQRRHRTCSRR